MSSGQQRNSLPKLQPKRLHTQGAPYRQHRFSQQVNHSRQINRQNTTLPLNPQKYKIKQSNPYKVRSRNRFDDQLFQLIQSKIPLDQKIKNKINSQNNHSTLDVVHQKTQPVQNPFVNSSIVLSQIQNFYHNRIKGKSHNQYTFSQFMSLLRKNNPLVQKVNPILFETLLKLGSIVTYHVGEAVYKQGAPIRNIGILLWGQTQLRKKTTKFRFNCYPGAAFGQELILEKRNYNSGNSGQITKGDFITFEKCKAVAESGVLFIGEREYRWVAEQLALQGLKEVVLCFQRLIQRTYLRKRQQRQLFG